MSDQHILKPYTVLDNPLNKNQWVEPRYGNLPSDQNNNGENISNENNSNGMVSTNSGFSNITSFDPDTLRQCEIEILKIEQNVGELNMLVAQSHDFDTIINTLMSENFYNKVLGLLNEIEKYNMKHLKCVMDKNKTYSEQYCGKINTVPFGLNAEKIDKLSTVVDRYEVLIKKFLNKLYDLSKLSYQYCGANGEILVKTRKLISKIGNLVVDEIDVNNGGIDLKNESFLKQSIKKENYFIGYIVILIFFILIGFVIYYRKKLKNISV